MMSSKASEVEELLLEKILSEDMSQGTSNQDRHLLESNSMNQQEIDLFNSTLDVYIQAENSRYEEIEEFDIWHELLPKLNTRKKPQSLYKRPNVQWLLAAVVAGLVIGISSFMDNSEELSANLTVVEIQSGQAFGTKHNRTELIWTENQFGLSMKNLIEGSHPSISISVHLKPQHAQRSSTFNEKTQWAHQFKKLKEKEDV